MSSYKLKYLVEKHVFVWRGPNRCSNALERDTKRKTYMVISVKNSHRKFMKFSNQTYNGNIL